MIRVSGAGVASQVLIAPRMLPETICDFSSDISLSTSTFALDRYRKRSTVIQTVRIEHAEDRPHAPATLFEGLR